MTDKTITMVDEIENNQEEEEKVVKNDSNEREMLPPYIRESYDRQFSVNAPPEDLEYCLFKEEDDGSKIGIASKGEVVVFYGPEKSRKSTVMGCIVASLFTDDVNRTLKFQLDLADDEEILWFDTEMGSKRYWRRQNMLTRMCGYDHGEDIQGYFSTYMKGRSYKEKLEIIDYHVRRVTRDKKVGVIVIDQVADLVTDINDRESVGEFIRYFEMWTEQSGALILCAIHVTRGTKLMTGVLGSELSKKMDNSFYLEKQYPSKNTKVQNLTSRDADVNNFEFNNNEYGYPIFIESGNAFR